MRLTRDHRDYHFNRCAESQIMKGRGVTRSGSELHKAKEPDDRVEQEACEL